MGKTRVTKYIGGKCVVHAKGNLLEFTDRHEAGLWIKEHVEELPNKFIVEEYVIEWLDSELKEAVERKCGRNSKIIHSFVK